MANGTRRRPVVGVAIAEDGRTVGAARTVVRRQFDVDDVELASGGTAD